MIDLIIDFLMGLPLWVKIPLVGLLWPFGSLLVIVIGDGLDYLSGRGLVEEEPTAMEYLLWPLSLFLYYFFIIPTLMDITRNLISGNKKGGRKE